MPQKTKLDEAIQTAKNSEGYFITVSRRNDKTLTHYWYRSVGFGQEDVQISLNHHIDSLRSKGQLPATTSGEIITIEDKDKKLPPEYRDGKKNEKEKVVRARIKV